MDTKNGRKYETYILSSAKDTELHLLIDTVTGKGERTNQDDTIQITASQVRKLVRMLQQFTREGSEYTLDHYFFTEEGA